MKNIPLGAVVIIASIDFVSFFMRNISPLRRARRKLANINDRCHLGFK